MLVRQTSECEVMPTTLYIARLARNGQSLASSSRLRVSLVIRGDKVTMRPVEQVRKAFGGTAIPNRFGEAETNGRASLGGWVVAPMRGAFQAPVLSPHAAVG